MEHTAQSSPPENRERSASPGLHRELRTWARDLVVALGLAVVIIVFFYQPVRVEGTSMTPALADQERIFINKFVYRLEPIERGDVVVFWYPLDHSKSFIKRVIGLPGDEVEIRRGRVYINGVALEETYVPEQFADRSSFAPMIVPSRSYFVMGDHRISSNDSRIFGPVPAGFIYGKAVFAYWPMAQFGTITPPTDSPAQ
jgi:signal peptidase I